MRSKAAAHVSRPLVGKTPSGRGVLDLSYERWAPNCHGLGVHRATLFNTLFDATKAAGVPVHCGVEIVRIDTPHRPVLIDAEQNSYGPFDLAIVANGAASGLRDALLPKARAPLYPWGAIWTIRPDETGAWDDVPRASLCRGARNDRRSTSRGKRPTRPAGTSPCFWSLREDKHDAWRAAGLQAWRADMASYWPKAAQLLDGFGDFEALPYARYRDVQAWPWGVGSTLLLGDAAHATSPQLGQGANLALSDAVVLAAALKSNAAIAPALAHYRRVRAAPVAWVQFMSAALTPVFQSRSHFIGWIRDALLGPLSGCWPFSRLMLATLTGAARLPSRCNSPAWPNSSSGIGAPRRCPKPTRRAKHRRSARYDRNSDARSPVAIWRPP